MKKTARLILALGALAATTAGGAGAVTAEPAPSPEASYSIAVRPGVQEDPHIGGSLVSYTDYRDGASVRVHDLATGVDMAIPQSPGDLDFLAETDGKTVVFTRITSDRHRIMAFDAATGTTTELDPRANSARQQPAVGGATVAWQDFGAASVVGSSEILVHDLVSGTTTALTGDGNLMNKNAAVSRDGSVVVWTKCTLTGRECDIWQATRSASGWSRGPVTLPSDATEIRSDTNGDIVVYDTLRVIGGADDLDIAWRSLASGAERLLELAGFQSNPSISGEVITFESFDFTAATPNTDIMLYDLRTDRLYRVTETPENESLNDVEATGDGRVTVVWTVADDVKGMTLRLPGTGDTTAPVLGLPSGVTVNATSPAGATVLYTASATDDQDVNPSLTCAPASGALFPIGVTTVSCTATDAAGNTVTGTFTVRVSSAADQIDDLRTLIESLNLKQGIENSLDAKLKTIQEALASAKAGDLTAACNKLDSFLNEVEAQAGKSITQAEAERLIADATRIKAVIGCG